MNKESSTSKPTLTIEHYGADGKLKTKDIIVDDSPKKYRPRKWERIQFLLMLFLGFVLSLKSGFPFFLGTITNAGLAAQASRESGDGGEAAFTYMAIGQGTTPSAITDTQLESEITTGGGQRKAATVSRITTSITNDTNQLQATFNFTSNFNVSEIGIFNASSNGTMMTRIVSSAKPVGSGESLVFTWRDQKKRTA